MSVDLFLDYLEATVRCPSSREVLLNFMADTVQKKEGDPKILTLKGGPCSGKSFLAETLRELVSPSRTLTMQGKHYVRTMVSGFNGHLLNNSLIILDGINKELVDFLKNNRGVTFRFKYKNPFRASPTYNILIMGNLHSKLSRRLLTVNLNKSDTGELRFERVRSWLKGGQAREHLRRYLTKQTY